MSYDFSSMTFSELSRALQGPTGDTFARAIAAAAIRLGENVNAQLVDSDAGLSRLAKLHMNTVGTFGWVLEGLKEGRRFAREGWNGKGMFIFLVGGSTFTADRDPLLSILGEGAEVDYHAHVDIRTADGTIVPWVASHSDLLSDDWEEVR